MAMLSGRFGGAVVMTRTRASPASAVVERIANSAPANSAPRRKPRLKVMSTHPQCFSNIPRVGEEGESCISRESGAENRARLVDDPDQVDDLARRLAPIILALKRHGVDLQGMTYLLVGLSDHHGSGKKAAVLHVAG